MYIPFKIQKPIYSFTERRSFYPTRKLRSTPPRINLRQNIEFKEEIFRQPQVFNNITGHPFNDFSVYLPIEDESYPIKKDVENTDINTTECLESLTSRTWESPLTAMDILFLSKM